MSTSDLIKILSENSDKYGYSHLVGCLNEFNKNGFKEITKEQLEEYIAKHVNRND